MPLFAGIVPHKKAEHHRKESESGYMGESHMFHTMIVALNKRLSKVCVLDRCY